MTCDLPAVLDVLPEELELIELWLGEMLADLSGGNGATSINRTMKHKEK